MTNFIKYGLSFTICLLFLLPKEICAQSNCAKTRLNAMVDNDTAHKYHWEVQYVDSISIDKISLHKPKNWFRKQWPWSCDYFEIEIKLNEIDTTACVVKKHIGVDMSHGVLIEDNTDTKYEDYRIFLKTLDSEFIYFNSYKSKDDAEFIRNVLTQWYKNGVH